MSLSHPSFFTLCFVALSAATGCSSARDVEVTGTAAPAPGLSTKGAVIVEVFDLADAEDPKLVGTTKPDAAGKFGSKFTVEGDTLRLRAIDDADGNGGCTDGELWGAVEVKVTDDAVKDATVELRALPCPK
ncbi:MAG: hypothetical protein IT374_18665 [Polyangiaceae bacterium]|nr:hypothetical protein [Polyangiaceae bacterium]